MRGGARKTAPGYRARASAWRFLGSSVPASTIPVTLFLAYFNPNMTKPKELYSTVLLGSAYEQSIVQEATVMLHFDCMTATDADRHKISVVPMAVVAALTCLLRANLHMRRYLRYCELSCDEVGANSHQ